MTRRVVTMRIIGGRWRSRQIAAPPTPRTRPMPARVREAVFDILASHYSLPGLLPELHAVDLFAGSGSLGLEALSRGVADCLFIERRAAAMACIRRNIEALAASPAAEVLVANAWTAPLTTPQPEPPFDLVFLDPPYADARKTEATAKVPRLLDDLMMARWVHRDTILVLHAEAAVQHLGGDDWAIADHREYGTSGITFLSPSRDLPEPPPPPDFLRPAADAKREGTAGAN